MTPATTTAPSLEQLIAEARAVAYYGVRLVEIGADAEWLVAAGHVEPRRMVAACNAYARESLAPLTDLGTLADILGRIHHRTAVVLQPCPGQVHDEDCETCRGAAWGLNWRDDTPGRDVPITVLDWQ